MIDIDFPSGCAHVRAKEKAQRKPGLHVNTPALRGEFKPASSTGEIMTYPLDIKAAIRLAKARLHIRLIELRMSRRERLAAKTTRVVAADRSGREAA